MIEITRIVDKSVLDKVNIDLLKEHLPETAKNIFITFCATRQARKEDVWEKEGTLYLRIILDFKKIVSLKVDDVVKIMRDSTLSKLDELGIFIIS